MRNSRLDKSLLTGVALAQLTADILQSEFHYPLQLNTNVKQTRAAKCQSAVSLRVTHAKRSELPNTQPTTIQFRVASEKLPLGSNLSAKMIAAAKRIDKSRYPAMTAFDFIALVS